MGSGDGGFRDGGGRQAHRIRFGGGECSGPIYAGEIFVFCLRTRATYLKLSRLIHRSRAALTAMFSITVSSDN